MTTIRSTALVPASVSTRTGQNLLPSGGFVERRRRQDPTKMFNRRKTDVRFNRRATDAPNGLNYGRRRDDFGANGQLRRRSDQVLKQTSAAQTFSAKISEGTSSLPGHAKAFAASRVFAEGSCYFSGQLVDRSA